MVRTTCQTMRIIDMWIKINFCVIILCAHVKDCGNAMELRKNHLSNEMQIRQIIWPLCFLSKVEVPPDRFASDLKGFLL